MPDNSRELLQKYNRNSAHLTVLYDQLDKKSEELENLKESQARQEKAARTLCEMILRKEQDVRTEEEKKKGVKGEAPWFTLSTVKLIEKAQESYEKSFEKATKDKITFVEAYSKKIGVMQKILNENVEQLKKLEKELQEAEKAGAKGKEEIQKDSVAAKEGKSSEKDLRGKKNILGNTEIKGAVTEADMLESLGDDIEKLQVEKENSKKKGKGRQGESFPVSDNAQKVLDKKEEAVQKKKAEEKKKDPGRFKEVLETMTQNEKNVLICMGEQGFSELKEVISNMESLISESKTRTYMKDLMAKGFLTGKSLVLPMVPNLNLFWLSESGKDLYRELTGKEPVLSMAEKVKKEHTSLEHGYGIMKMTEKINGSGYVKANQAEASCFRNRKQIKLADGKAFVPDIVISNETEILMYIEYETTKCTEADFMDKCDKFVQVADTLNFIVPGLNEEEVLKKHAEKWLVSARKRGIFGKPITIRVATIKTIIDSCKKDELSWNWEKRINSSKK